jgi:hypothetical protein
MLLSFPVLTKPIINLFHGIKKNKEYRQHLSEYKDYKLNYDFIKFINDAIKIFECEECRGILD